MATLADALGAFRGLTRFTTNGEMRKRTLACLKQALADRGVVHDPSVAPGTPPLTDADRAQFSSALGGVAAHIAAHMEPRWRTPA